MDKRNFEIDFITDYILAQAKKNLNMDTSVIRYNTYSIKNMNEVEENFINKNTQL